jgi:hypothetical protein
VIVRIMGEGQYDVDGAHTDVLNALDAGLEQAVQSGDDARFTAALADLLAKVRTVGERMPDDTLTPSDAVLPPDGAHVDEVRELLSGSAEGLIPG